MEGALPGAVATASLMGPALRHMLTAGVDDQFAIFLGEGSALRRG